MGREPSKEARRRKPASGTPRKTSSLPVVESTVEPKLVERRRQVRAQARARRVRKWVILAAIAGFVGAAIGVVLSPIFDVDKVSVKGNEALTAGEVEALSGVAKGDRLVSVDLAEVRSQLMDDPRIASAKVAVRLPGTLDIRIIEETPLVEFEAKDGTLLVSATGRVLAAAGPAGTALASAQPSPQLVDYDGSIEKATELASPDGLSQLVGRRPGGVIADSVLLVNRLPEDLRGQVNSIRIAGDKTVTLGLPGEAEVKLGQPTELEAKVVATRAVLSQVVLDCLKSIDVREPTRAAVSRGPGCPGVSPEPSSSDTRQTDDEGD